MEILWWLAPPVVATVLAMLWVSWLGREGRGEVDPEVAARRLGDAMARPTRVTPRADSDACDGPGRAEQRHRRPPLVPTGIDAGAHTGNRGGVHPSRLLTFPG